jgi:hypothetical protein
MAFYRSPETGKIERWVPGGGREDVTAFRNDYAALRQTLAQAGRSQTPAKEPKARHAGTPLRVKDLLQAGLLKPGDVVYTRKRPDLRATVVDSRFVEYEGKRWKYNDWGTHATGWAAINIYREFVLARTGQTLDELREQLKDKLND